MFDPSNPLFNKAIATFANENTNLIASNRN